MKTKRHYGRVSPPPTNGHLPAVAPLLRLDLGCGKAKQPGFHGVDAIAFEGVDTVHDLRKPWPWVDGSVEDVHCSHFLEHLTARERCHFCNELYRVLKVGGKAQIIVPYWASSRAYGDPTHQWPPIGEMFFQYVLKEWRKSQAPHTDAEFLDWGYNCDFDVTYGYSLHPGIQAKHQEAQQHALTFYKEAAQDIIATWTRRDG